MRSVLGVLVIQGLLHSSNNLIDQILQKDRLEVSFHNFLLLSPDSIFREESFEYLFDQEVTALNFLEELHEQGLSKMQILAVLYLLVEFLRDKKNYLQLDCYNNIDWNIKNDQFVRELYRIMQQRNFNISNPAVINLPKNIESMRAIKFESMIRGLPEMNDLLLEPFKKGFINNISFFKVSRLIEIHNDLYRLLVTDFYGNNIKQESFKAVVIKELLDAIDQELQRVKSLPLLAPKINFNKNLALYQGRLKKPYTTRLIKNELNQSPLSFAGLSFSSQINNSIEL